MNALSRQELERLGGDRRTWLEGIVRAAYGRELGELEPNALVPAALDRFSESELRAGYEVQRRLESSRFQREPSRTAQAMYDAIQRKAAARSRWAAGEAERLERLGYPENAAALRRASGPVRVPDPGRGLTTTEGAELELDARARRARLGQ